jgi:hypothetical protein
VNITAAPFSAAARWGVAGLRRGAERGELPGDAVGVVAAVLGAVQLERRIPRVASLPSLA